MERGKEKIGEERKMIREIENTREREREKER